MKYSSLSRVIRMNKENNMKEFPDFTDYYANGYNEAVYGKGLMPFCMRQSHKLLESAFGEKDKFETVLEIGAGLGHHLPFVRHTYSKYIMTDSNKEVISHLQKKTFPKVEIQLCEQGNTELPFENDSVDRLIAAHVLEHLHHPEQVLKEWNRVLKPGGGVISILLPCDPGVAWRFGRFVSARNRAHTNGLQEYDLFMALEHVNAINNLIAIIRYAFPNRQEKWWPFKISSMDINLFYAVHIYK